MHLGQHSDTELVRLAKAGWSPAFAVLVHRHAPMVHAALRDDPDPLSATTAVFVHAMRELRSRDAAAPIGPWLLQLIDRPPPSETRDLSAEELDAIWLELDRRWPDGERPATTWPWRRLAAVAGVTVLAAAVPAIVLGIEAPEAGELELRAVPVTDERPTPETSDDESLPSFSFPVAPEDDGTPAAEPETDSTPTTSGTEPAPTESAPEPQPQPDPEPTSTEPAPEPTEGPEPSESGDPDDDGGGVLDPVLGGDEQDGAADRGGTADDGDSGSADSDDVSGTE